ncbi:MAG TPA: ammonia-forming cytochrome c nitrite reductase subunit c552, partial [Thermoanaerobaculia bacterium]|nr:ammonia-forming cytochrome c nitrite reductase subunit c552 [Thermoanaerobaculia bacterium]
QRRSQFLADFIEAENSMGFHADQEALRVLGLSINYARLGLAALWAPGAQPAAAPLLPPPPQTAAPPEAVRGGIFESESGSLARPGERASRN